ncbi:hypothetical protein [Streptomyces antibioticus]|uniref:TetR/AcrR family transcriptional regulator n=1 Tax=Streptomyces antibioticus TaxID=1890 RepID=UPI0033C79EDA
MVLLRSALTDERAATRLHEIFATQIAPAISTMLGPELAARRAALVSAQLLGLGLTRYLLRLPAVTALTHEEIENGLAPAIDAALGQGPDTSGA